MLLMSKFTRVCIKTMPQPIEKHGLRANSVLSLELISRIFDRTAVVFECIGGMPHSFA